MKEKHIPVGIYNNEVFIAEFEDGKVRVGCDGKPIFGVLRVVDEDMLEKMRDQSYREEDFKDHWKMAVHAGSTEQSFQDWYDDLWAEEFDEDDPEDFLWKDASDLEYLVGEDRLAADNFLASRGINVGTWESSGSYAPDTEVYHEDGWYSDFKEWDYVFNSKEAEEIAADFVKKFVK